LQKRSDVRNESEKGKKRNMSVFHKSESESHKPDMRYNKKEEENLVMIATKSEMRDVRKNLDQILIILVCKDTLLQLPRRFAESSIVKMAGSDPGVGLAENHLHVGKAYKLHGVTRLGAWPL
jgi:hypothetical protein